MRYRVRPGMTAEVLEQIYCELLRYRRSEFSAKFKYKCAGMSGEIGWNRGSYNLTFVPLNLFLTGAEVFFVVNYKIIQIIKLLKFRRL